MLRPSFVEQDIVRFRDIIQVRYARRDAALVVVLTKIGKRRRLLLRKAAMQRVLLRTISEVVICELNASTGPVIPAIRGRHFHRAIRLTVQILPARTSPEWPPVVDSATSP